MTTATSCPALPRTPPRRLPPHLAFPMLALVLFAFFFAASAPSPLFVVMQQAWGFSPSLLTVAFAVYAIALLASLLVAGSLSDHIGRRPVILGALVLEAVAMAMFALAEGISGVIAARVVQGLATGIASGAMSAAVIEAAPASQKRLGALISSVSPLAGLALGALLTGTAAELAAQPVPLVFGSLAVLFAACAVGIWFAPESVAPRPGVWASLVPRVSIAAAARAEFLRGTPVLVTVWALGGLYLSLVPSVIRQIFHVHSGIVNGLAIAVLSGMGALAPTLLRRFAPPRTAALGMLSLVAGVGLMLVSLATGSMAVFFAGTLLSGVGFGASFSAVVQVLAPFVGAHQRSELFAAIFVVSYLAFSIPAMVAGLLVTPLGLLATVQGYGALVLVTAAVAAGVQWRRAAALGQ